MKSGFARTRSKKGLLLLALFCLCAVYPAGATDGIYNQFGLDLGYAGRISYMGGTTPHWAVFAYGAGTAGSLFNAIDVSAPPGSTPYQIDGNLALAGVYSTLTLSGQAAITGDRYEQTTSQEFRSGNAFLGGTRHSSASINTDLNGGVTSLKNVSNQAAALPPTAGSPSTLNLQSGANMFIDNNPFGGKYVMRLTDLVLGGGSTLTLNGASGSAFVINVSRNFSLSGASRIVLSGGLTPSDVLFNIRGNPSGAQLEITGNSLFNGTLLAYNSSGGGQRTLAVNGHQTMTNGELIVNRLVLSSGAKVKHPKKKSEE
jgi:hypothetical protein